MHEKLLAQTGLTQVQSEIYGYLLENKEERASIIAQKINRPRGVIYKGLDELLAYGFVEKIDRQKVTLFRAEHPSRLERVLVEKDKQIKQQMIEKERVLDKDRAVFAQSLPDLVSVYNISHHKPGVLFFEGEDGLRRVLEDTITSKTEILLYLDDKTLMEDENFKQISEEYKNKRIKTGIKQRILIVGERPFREPSQGAEYEKLTEIRYTGKSDSEFKASVKIYNEKISYQVFGEQQIISVLIEDRNIYEMNRSWFDDLWSKSK